MDKIVTEQKILRIISRETSWEEVEKLDLEKRLQIATESAWTKGLGLAAIQIGLPLKFAWYRWSEGDYFLMNPEIVEVLGKKKLSKEGCLSIPDTRVNVRRPYKIKYLNDGHLFTAKGDRARIIQHEVDHMNGILIIDYL